MAKGNFETDAQYFSGGSPGVTDVPLTVSFWFYTTDATKSQWLWQIGTGVNDSHSVYLFGASGSFRISSVVGGTGGTAVVGTASANTWNHAVGVFGSDAARTGFLNGTPISNTTSANVPSPYTAHVAGTNIPSTADLDGYIAELGVWNVTLDPAEVNALAKGFSCHLIRPSSLVHHCPMVRSGQDLRGDLSETGTINVFPHPPIIGAIAA